MPKSRKAATTDRSVRNVRVLLRNNPAQIRCRYFILDTSVSGRVAHLFGERALVEMQRVRRVFRGFRVVRDHHYGLAVLAVKLLQKSQDLLRGLPVEVAGRLVADKE